MAKVIESHSEINSKIVNISEGSTEARQHGFRVKTSSRFSSSNIQQPDIWVERGNERICSEPELAKASAIEEGRHKGFWGTNGNNIKIVHYENQQWIKRQVREEIEEWTCWKWEEGDWAAILVDVKGEEGKVVGKEGKLRFKDLVRSSSAE